MSVPMFIQIYSNGNIWVDNTAHRDPKTFNGTQGEAGTLVTCVRVNSDASLQKVATLTGSGNASASALADSLGKGTGATGSKHTVKELT
jgi:hypothetical protein